MLLAIDIGNSLIKYGVFDGDKLLDKFAIPTKRDYSPGDFQFDRLRSFRIDAVVTATVVPELIDVVRRASRTNFKVTPTFIDHSTDFGLKINYDPPESVGIDRLVNAFAAAEKYGTPLIVCSFGTATVIDAVNRENEFLGGMIAPGVKTMAEALRQTTSQLPIVEIEQPGHLIGNSTEISIQSGIVNGHIAMAEGLIQRIKLDSELDTRNSELKVVATGGFAKLIASKIDAVTHIDENLTLEGIRLLAERI
jgi:type III pantothenate kinase